MNPTDQVGRAALSDRLAALESFVLTDAALRAKHDPWFAAEVERMLVQRGAECARLKLDGEHIATRNLFAGFRAEIAVLDASTDPKGPRPNVLRRVLARWSGLPKI